MSRKKKSEFIPHLETQIAYKEFGQRLKEYAQKNFGSVNNFANKMGVSQPTISQYLSAKRFFGGEMFLKMMELGVDIPAIVFGDKLKNKSGDNLINSTKYTAKGDKGITNAGKHLAGTFTENHGFTAEQVLELIKNAEKRADDWKEIAENRGKEIERLQQTIEQLNKK